MNTLPKLFPLFTTLGILSIARFNLAWLHGARKTTSAEGN